MVSGSDDFDVTADVSVAFERLRQEYPAELIQFGFFRSGKQVTTYLAAFLVCYRRIKVLSRFPLPAFFVESENASFVPARKNDFLTRYLGPDLSGERNTAPIIQSVFVFPKE